MCHNHFIIHHQKHKITVDCIEMYLICIQIPILQIQVQEILFLTNTTNRKKKNIQDANEGKYTIYIDPYRIAK